MYIIDDCWGLIKSFLIHNIKIHGKHLVDCKYIKQYNGCLKGIKYEQPENTIFLRTSNNFVKNIFFGHKWNDKCRIIITEIQIDN
jgi:hypothetical protein